MKRFLAFLLAIIFCLSMAACSASDSFDDEDEDEEEEQSEKDENNDGGGNDASGSVTVESQVIYDQNNFKITVNGLKFDEFVGPTLELTVENNSSVNANVSIDDLSINDVMVGSIFYCETAAGKTANESMYIVESYLTDGNITVIKEFEFKLRIYDPDTYDTLFESETITLETSADPSYVQTYDNSGIVILDDDNMRVVVLKVRRNDDYEETEVMLFIENKSSRSLTLQTENVSVNGFMMDPIFSSTILPGKKAYATLGFSYDDLNQNGVADLETMELVLEIIDWDEYSNTYSTEPITVTFADLKK